MEVAIVQNFLLYNWMAVACLTSTFYALVNNANVKVDILILGSIAMSVTQIAKSVMKMWINV